MRLPGNGFQRGGNVADLFEGAAPCYARYRRPYPPLLVAHLVHRYQLDGRGRLLDAGCGTGQAFQVFGQYFDEVVAIDVNSEMLHYAVGTAETCGLQRFSTLQRRGEEIDARLGTFRMAVFGASFHWMDRSLVADLVYDRLEPGGVMAVLSPSGFHAGTTDWELEIQRTVQKWLGPERRAGQGIYAPGERHGEVLRRSRFGQVEETDFPVLEEFTLDEILGYLASTSYASPAVLREENDGFRETISHRLLQLHPEGRFRKVTEYTAICTTR